MLVGFNKDLCTVHTHFVLKMSDEYQRRAAIIVCLRSGRSPADIAVFTKLTRAAAYIPDRLTIPLHRGK